MTKADLGLIGLAVMGQNLALNMADHGFTVSVYNRTPSVTDDYVAGPAAGSSIIGNRTLEDLVASLTKPRRVMLMIKAGPPVDAVIDQLVALLDEGDIIIDGGNSLFTDTIRRTASLGEKGIHFIGAGISGGEEGARHGPSIMPGGSAAGWPYVKDIFQSIAAKVTDGTPCADWVGPDGAGHYVKMVHNGIEYGDMQVIAEAYHLMRAAGFSNEEMGAAFRSWNEGVLNSFLIQITADILSFRDADGSFVIDQILDTAGQKGTGKWAVISAMELAQPVTLVAEAVFARIVSALKGERREAASALAGPSGGMARQDGLLDSIHDALYGSKIVSYAQGFMLLKAASEEHHWALDFGRIASLWREGCIIRARFLDDITRAFRNRPDLPNLLFDDFFAKAVGRAQDGWRRVVSEAVSEGIPVPAYSSALAFYDSYRSSSLPANLIQALRDFFGAHTYERIDRPAGEFFHTNWTGEGGKTTAGSYQA
jgi:6-phosphogluconate dehydrogenase